MATTSTFPGTMLTTLRPQHQLPVSRRARLSHQVCNNICRVHALTIFHCTVSHCAHVPPRAPNSNENDDEASLVDAYDVNGANGDEIFGYDVEGDDGEDSEDGEDGEMDEGGSTVNEAGKSYASFRAFQASVRVDAAKRAEGNRRAGGLRTQKAMVRAWEVCQSLTVFCRSDRGAHQGFRSSLPKRRQTAMSRTALLMSILCCSSSNSVRNGPSEHAKVPTSPGHLLEQSVSFDDCFCLCSPFQQSHLKKMFFGALRIRKEQDAHDRRLAQRRPPTSVIVWDAIKNRMDESLERVRGFVAQSNGFNQY